MDVNFYGRNKVHRNYKQHIILGTSASNFCLGTYFYLEPVNKINHASIFLYKNIFWSALCQTKHILPSDVNHFPICFDLPNFSLLK
ncbi:hypothetical protein JTB14_012447 [Gonioctena quinquepunctata]|nr:hypothetical protein JTB14_012447 [Gonioctena quinquepunctata]